MKKYFFLAILLTLAWGCASAVRYSPDEIKDYPPEIQQYIRDGDVAMGMTTQQVRYALGSPSIVNILSPSLEGKPREEWIYSASIGFVVKRRLLFIDGKLADVYPEGERPAEASQPAEKSADQQAEQPAEQPAEKSQDGKK